MEYSRIQQNIDDNMLWCRNNDVKLAAAVAAAVTEIGIPNSRNHSCTTSRLFCTTAAANFTSLPLHHSVLSSIFCHIPLYFTLFHSSPLYSGIFHSIPLYSTLLFRIIPYTAIPCSPAWRSPGPRAPSSCRWSYGGGWRSDIKCPRPLRCWSSDSVSGCEWLWVTIWVI